MSKSPSLYQPVDVFVAYSHEDKAWCDIVVNALKHRPMIHEVWRDGEITPGQEWDERIREKLNSAHVILPLVSRSFFSSDYINRIELPRAMERRRNGEAQVVPILVRPYVLRGTALGGLQALPIDKKNNLKPLNEWKNKIDDAVVSIIEGIEKSVRELRAVAPMRSVLRTRMPGCCFSPTEIA